MKHEVTVWMADDVPERLFYGGRRWRVSDVPTRLRSSVWEVGARGGPVYGWRFQATDETGEAFVFDVFQEQDGWHVHGVYC